MSLDAARAALNAFEQGRPEQAMALLRSMGASAADDPLALQLWALIAGSSGARADALALHERAVRIAPGDAQVHFNLAVSLQGADDLTRAVLHYERALRLQPDHLGALNNQSDLFRRRGRPQEGWRLLERYQRVGGDPRGLEIRYAKMAMDTRRFEEAGDWFERAERHAPGDASVEWEHAMLLLAQERFAEGWLRYERRLDAYGLDNLGVYPYALPRWTGEDLTGKRLLLHREQGLGDMIMFASVLDELIQEGAALHLALHPPLARLMAINFPKARVWSSVTHAGTAVQPEQDWLHAAGPLDLQAPVCSLGAARRVGSFPAPRTYLKADPQDQARWKTRLDALASPRPAARRIGLVLAARQNGFTDDGRTMAWRKSILPRDAAALAGPSNIQWVSLHDRETAFVLADTPLLDAIDPSPWITDLADTAAIIANLDLVVSVDTAVAHLAAAMGKPVWLLLQWTPDWRWGIDREDSYWYPDVRVFRQPKPQDWPAVLDAVVRALA